MTAKETWSCGLCPLSFDFCRCDKPTAKGVEDWREDQKYACVHCGDDITGGVEQILRAARHSVIDECDKAIEAKLSEIMAGNYSYLVESYKSQLKQALRALKERTGG